MGVLGNGLYAADHDADALSVREAQLATMRRVGDSEHNILAVQGDLANTYMIFGRLEEALQIRQDAHARSMKLYGRDHSCTVTEVSNLANVLNCLHRSEEAKSLLREAIPIARRVLGENDIVKFRMQWNYARALYLDTSATLHDLREAVTRFVEIERTARRVFGEAHPFLGGVGYCLQEARAALRARETPSGSA